MVKPSVIIAILGGAVAVALLVIFLINVVVPAIQHAGTGATEGLVKSATGVQIDLNNDGTVSGYGDVQSGGIDAASGKSGYNGGAVEGIE
ncbi:hypothetical protein AGMMS49975_17380 [Clostridia bacterium]|nr:hypothetical protein AGMMS49975_17380 [Clostridia bacterium]